MNEIYKASLIRLKKGTSYQEAFFKDCFINKEILFSQCSLTHASELLTGKRIRTIRPTPLNNVARANDIYIYIYDCLDQNELGRYNDFSKQLKAYLDEHQDVDAWRQELDSIQSEFIEEARLKDQAEAEQKRLKEQERHEMITMMKKNENAKQK